MQIKTLMRYHYKPIRGVKIQQTKNTQLLVRFRTTEILIRCWYAYKKWVQPLEDRVHSFPQGQAQSYHTIQQLCSWY